VELGAGLGQGAGAGRNECIGRRHELLVCVADARREQDAGRGEELHELLGRVARIPPEIVREHVVQVGR
jgi:hypothetical protein